MTPDRHSNYNHTLKKQGKGISIAVHLWVMLAKISLSAAASFQGEYCMAGSKSKLNEEESGGIRFGDSGIHGCPCNKCRQMQMHLLRDKEEEMGRIFAYIMILVVAAYLAVTLYLLKERFNIEVKINIDRDQGEGGEVGNHPPEGPMEDVVVWAHEVHRLPNNDDAFDGALDDAVAMPVNLLNPN